MFQFPVLQPKYFQGATLNGALRHIAVGIHELDQCIHLSRSSLEQGALRT
jgi:hypothetical protein